MLKRVTIICMLLFAATNAGADDPDIHKMMVGSKVLEVVQTRQLTFRKDGDVRSITISPNGRYAVYLTVQPNMDSDYRIGRLYLAKLSGGKPILLMEGSLWDSDYPDSLWMLQYCVLWSPDSKLIAIEAGRKPDDDVAAAGYDTQEARRERRWAIVFFDTTGSMVLAHYFPEGTYVYPSRWSPDSRRIAMVCKSERSLETGERDNAIIVYDVADKQTQTLYSSKTSRIFIPLNSWIENGSAVLCLEPLGQGRALYRKLYLDGRTPVEYEGAFDGLSLDKVYGFPFHIKAAEEGAAVEDIETGKTVCVVKGLEPRELRSLPKTRFLIYTREQTIRDGSDRQETKLGSLWLMYPEGGAQNRMCVALDREFGASWSNGCRRLAYTSRSRAFVTELEFREATAREKAAAGIRLTEEETRTLMLENARQIADAIGSLVFCSEYYPSEDGFIEAIKHHLRDANALLRPGTDKIAVTYFKPDGKYNLANPPPPDTLIAIVDFGLGQQVNIFDDGHVEEVRKQ